MKGILGGIIYVEEVEEEGQRTWVDAVPGVG